MYSCKMKILMYNVNTKFALVLQSYKHWPLVADLFIVPTSSTIHGPYQNSTILGGGKSMGILGNA